jgi:uncharacterized protein DUF3604
MGRNCPHRRPRATSEHAPARPADSRGVLPPRGGPVRPRRAGSAQQRRTPGPPRPAPPAPGPRSPTPAPTPAAPAARRAPPPANPPFEITEDRPRCSNYEPRRQPLFGTTHLHTGLSFDASIRFVDYQSGNSPRGAYRFAQGKATIQLPDPSGAQRPGPTIGGGPSRTPKIDRPIDWGAVTDHSEHFGVMGICKDLAGKDIPERLSMECRMINAFFYQPGHAVNPVLGSTLASNAFTQLTITSDGAISHNTNLPVCENNPALCARAELEVSSTRSRWAWSPPPTRTPA